MLSPSPLLSSATLAIFLQTQIAAVWALPEQKPATTMLYQKNDPYTQALLRLEYDQKNNTLVWRLLNDGLELSRQTHTLDEATETVNTAVIFGGDQTVVAGRTKKQNWFLQALDWQGGKQWEHSGEGRIYDLTFSDDGKEVYGVGHSENTPLFMVIDFDSGAVRFHSNCSYFIGKTPSSEFFATVLLSCSSGEMNLANKI